MGADSEIRLVVDALKKIVKAKGFTYRDIATEMGVSEQTVKRFFIEADVSLARLARICEIVEIPLDELFSAALRQPSTDFRLTEAQEEVLVSTPGLFGLYDKLQGGMSPALICKTYGISALTMRRSLRLLENAKLLTRTQRDSIKLSHKGNFSWLLGGPLQKKFLVEREADFARHHVGRMVSSGRNVADGYLNSSEYELRPETWRDFVNSISQAVKAVHDRSAREQPFCKPSERKQYHWLLVLAPEQHISDSDILELKEVP